jgi:ABC-type transport system substrate-binding protein
MKKRTLFLVLLLVFSTLLTAGCTQQQPAMPAPTLTPAPGMPSPSTTAATAVPTVSRTAPVGQSTLIIAIRDGPKTTDIGTISHLWLDVSEVSVHRASGDQTANDTSEEMVATESDDTSTAGWTVVVNQTHMVDLIQLANTSLVLDQKMVDAGRYTQIRLKIDSGTITVDNTDYNLAVPSGVLKLNRGFVLEPDKTLKITLDFNAERSVIRTGSDKYTLKPVIAVISG